MCCQTDANHPPNRFGHTRWPAREATRWREATEIGWPIKNGFDFVSILARSLVQISSQKLSPESQGALVSFRGESLAMQGVATMTTSMIVEQAVEDAVGELHFATESDIIDHLDRISGKFADKLERCSG